MNTQERKNIYLENLKTIIEDGGENNYVVFREPRSEKSLQYAGAKGDGITIDIPYKSLDEKEMNRFIEKY